MSNEANPQTTYWHAVKNLAEAVLEREAGGEELSDVLHEEVDGSYYVIYYHAARECLEFSSNKDAAFESIGDDALSGCDSYGMVVTRLAFFALEQDVLAAVEDLRPELEDI